MEKPKPNYLTLTLTLTLISLAFVLFITCVFYLGRQSIKIVETPVAVLPTTTKIPTPTEFTESKAQVDESSIIKQTVTDKVYSYGKDHGLKSKNQIIVSVGKIIDNFASGTTSFTSDVEGSGNGWIAVKIDGLWKVIAEFQEPPSCAVMRQYQVPVDIYGSCNE